jgi:hypothetical protein
VQQNYAHARKGCNKYDLPRLLLDSSLSPCSLCISFILEFLLALPCNLITTSTKVAFCFTLLVCHFVDVC